MILTSRFNDWFIQLCKKATKPFHLLGCRKQSCNVYLKGASLFHQCFISSKKFPHQNTVVYKHLSIIEFVYVCLLKIDMQYWNAIIFTKLSDPTPGKTDHPVQNQNFLTLPKHFLTLRPFWTGKQGHHKKHICVASHCLNTSILKVEYFWVFFQALIICVNSVRVNNVYLSRIYMPDIWSNL